MGDWNHWIADIEVGSGEAPDLARNVLDWLIETKVVRAERTECVLGESGVGHPPGAAYRTVVTEPYDGFLDEWANGLEIDIGRVACYSAVGEDDRVGCPRCAAWLPFEAVLPVIEDWEDGGPDEPACPGCGARSRLNDWRWPVPCAFAALGLRFWNWPPLRAEFLAELGERLGHRTVAGTS